MFKKELENIKVVKPLVHNITNYVTVNDCANIILGIGGSPLMSDDINEVEEIVGISSALYLNIGTLNKRTVESMKVAGKKANELGIPVVLDPVGVGASTLRNETVERLLEDVKFSAIKGNMSEIKALLTSSKNSRGVDVSEEDMVSIENVESAEEIIDRAAKNFNCVIAATGEIDIISDGKRKAIIKNGDEMMGRITGTGCMLGSLIATFIGANKENVFEATAAAVTTMGIAGEIAAEKVGVEKKGTGTFRMYLIDAISLMSGIIVEEGGQVEFK